MRLRAPVWLVGAGLAILVGVGASLWRVNAPRAPEPQASQEPAAVRISQAAVIVRHHGQRQAEIAADHVEVSADQRTATFTGHPRVVVYVGDSPALTATGERIVLDRQTQDVRVEGGLRITTVLGVTLVARSASWDQETQVAELTGGVEVTFPVRWPSP